MTLNREESAVNFYYTIQSPYAQKVLIALYEKGVAFTPVKVNVLDPADRAAYQKIYPLGKIPLLTDESKDLFIPESTIIIEFLENEFPGQGTQLIPDDKVAARRVRFKDRMSDLYINATISTIFFDSMKPEDKRNPEAVTRAREHLDVMYRFMDDFLGKNEYVAGSEFSMADCATFPGLFYAQQMHPFSAYPNVVAYLQRLMQRPSVQKVVAELMPLLQAMQGK